MLPPLLQLKAISERFTKLALSPFSASASASTRHGFERERERDGAAAGGIGGGAGSRLMLAANGHGALKIGVETPSLKIESQWDGLVNPELDPRQVEGGEEGVRGHASTRMREEGGWACVRVEGRDWGRVLGVGRMGGRVIACFCHDHALVLYVYLSNTEGDDSVLTVCFCELFLFFFPPLSLDSISTELDPWLTLKSKN